MNWLETCLKGIQLKGRYLFGLFLFGAIVLLVPTSLSQRLHLEQVRDVAGVWIGLATVGTFLFWLVAVGPWVCGKYRSYRREQAVLRNIETLNDNELFFIRYCLYKMHRTVYLPVGNAAAESLCHKGLMEKASMGDTTAFPFTVPQRIWKRLLLQKSQLLPKSALKDPELTGAFDECSRRMKEELY